jgi:hypothetical protein
VRIDTVAQSEGRSSWRIACTCERASRTTALKINDGDSGSRRNEGDVAVVRVHGVAFLGVVVWPCRREWVWWAWTGSREAGRVRSFRKGLAPCIRSCLPPSMTTAHSSVQIHACRTSPAPARSQCRRLQALTCPFAPTTPTSLPDHRRLASPAPPHHRWAVYPP